MQISLNWTLLRMPPRWHSPFNVDYKIISKAITIRLSKVIESIVHSDQTCSVPGRTIFSNVSLLRDILDHIDLIR